MAGEPVDRWAERLPRALARAGRVPASILSASAKQLQARLKALSPRRTGALSKSWRVTGEGEDVAVVSDNPAAAALEVGAVVRGSPWLAVPIALDARRYLGPRSDHAKMFVLRARDGRLFLASRNGGNVELRWRLMSSVTLRPRPYQRAEFDRIRKATGEAIAKGMTREIQR